MKPSLSILGLTGSLKAGLVAASMLLDAAAPVPFDTECEAITLPEHRPCTFLINRPRQPNLPSVSLQ